MRTTDYEAVRACALALLGGAVLKACDVTAGRGSAIDWREVRSGDLVQSDGDAFDTAYLFVSMVGNVAAMDAVECEVPPAVPAPVVQPRITAFMQAACGGRPRSFHVGEFTVIVEAHENDAAQAAFTQRLAARALEVSTPNLEVAS